MKDLGSHPGSLRRLVAGLMAVLVLALAAVGSGAGSDGLSGAQDADTIPAGFDLFETDPEQTVFRFRDQAAIPENFFQQGSHRFEGDVPFGGVPILRFRTSDTGDADTVVERKAAAVLPNDGSPSQPVQIELVRLSLTSMAPIDVKVGQSGTQQWSVRAEVSPTRPSSGQMTIARNNAKFGTFNSSLVVYPKFTFTRVTQGGTTAAQPQTKVLDVGALPDGTRPDDASLTFTAEGAPWRKGCVEPALAISLNADFCPGLGSGGHGKEPPANKSSDAHKVLTPHQSKYAQHGIWPVQPRLEHFVCYTAPVHTPFTLNPSRTLLDQFGTRTARVIGPDYLCNPARKNDEPFVNKKAHLRCYRTTAGPKLNRHVELVNQLGHIGARVYVPHRLCLPASKRKLNGPVPQNLFVTEHFQCYSIKTPLVGQQPVRTLKFTDQFQAFTVKVGRPSRLCVPVQKSARFPVQHKVRHLACYRVSGPTLKRDVIVQDQFTARQPKKAELLRTGAVTEVCIPTLKLG